MLILTGTILGDMLARAAARGDAVDGAAIQTSPETWLAPREMVDGRYALSDRVIGDPAHAAYADLLAAGESRAPVEADFTPA